MRPTVRSVRCYGSACRMVRSYAARCRQTAVEVAKTPSFSPVFSHVFFPAEVSSTFESNSPLRVGSIFQR